MRGCGRQYVGAVVSFIAYYIIALPLGAAIGFKTELGLFGIWIGMLVGNVAQVSLSGYCKPVATVKWVILFLMEKSLVTLQPTIARTQLQ